MQQPNCVFNITEGNITIVENLMIKLFQCSVPQTKCAGRLWPLIKCLLVTVIMYLGEMMTEYPRHRVLVTLKELAIDYDITMKELLEWGAIVKEKLASDHAIAIHSGPDATRRLAALCTTFHAVGRGGEAGLLTWKSLYWDFCGTWAQQKVHNALHINFFAHAQKYSICVVNALAFYLIVGAGARFLTPHNIDKGWVFPNLAAGTATTMLSNFLKECSTSFDELHSDVTATGLRVGSLCEIVYAEGGGLEVAIARGGWKGQ